MEGSTSASVSISVIVEGLLINGYAVLTEDASKGCHILTIAMKTMLYFYSDQEEPTFNKTLFLDHNSPRWSGSYPGQSE